MATLTIPWNDGNGNIILTYTGQGDGTVVVQSSTDNLGEDRSQVITLKTVGDNPVTATVTVVQQTGLLTLVSGDSYVLNDTDGKILKVYPQGYTI